MIILLYSLFAALSGLIEAVLYSRRAAEAFTRNEHIEMTVQRSAVMLLASAGFAYGRLPVPALYVCAELVAGLLLFPMVHDEAYNFARLWIKWVDFYQQLQAQCEAAGTPTLTRLDRLGMRQAWWEYRYGYQSPTTTARNDFNGRQRTILAALGGLTWAAGLIFYLATA